MEQRGWRLWGEGGFGGRTTDEGKGGGKCKAWIGAVYAQARQCKQGCRTMNLRELPTFTSAPSVSGVVRALPIKPPQPEYPSQYAPLHPPASAATTPMPAGFGHA